MSSFYPAITGRATTQLTTSRLLFQIHHDQSAIQALQTQLSTGRRIERPSQDPSAAIRALSAQRNLEFKAQADVNLKAADVILSASESTLAQAQSIITEMRGVAVLATGTTFSEEEAKSYADQVQAAISKLIDLGNSKFRDQYIFGGNNVLAPPYEYIGESVRFTGNNSELLTVADFALTIAANVTANDAFGAKSSQVVGSLDLNPRIVSTTPLSELNRGEGIRRGAISFSNGVELVTVDLANAHNVADIIERIEAVQVGTRNLDVTLSNTGINIAYADGNPGLLRIDEVGAGNMAADLGINNSGTAGLSPVVGSDLDPKMTRSTRLENLLGGTGINLGDAFQIQQGSKTYQISTNGLQTVEDLFNRIHRSGAQVSTSIDPSGRYIKIQSTESGTSMSIGEAGSNLASRLGLRTFDLGTPVSSLNNGQGIFTTDLGPDLILTRSNGTEIMINLNGVQNVNDVINRINNQVDNFTPALRIVASLATTGNGLVLTAPIGDAPIRVANAGGSQAATGLGLVPAGSLDTTGVNAGTSNSIRGRDVSGLEVESIFSSLIRMRQAIEAGRPEDMRRIADGLESDLQRMSMARSFVGTRQQSLANTLDLSAEQQLQLKEIESNELDADLAQVISELAAREAALQASLQLMGQSTRQSLFDYI